MVTNSEDESHLINDEHIKESGRAGIVPSNTIDETTTSAILSDELVAIRVGTRKRRDN